MAARYARMPIRDEDIYEAKLNRTRAYLHPGMKVLEIGCGTGTTALRHAPHVAHIHGVDYAPNMVAIAAEKAAAEKIGNVRFDCLGLEAVEGAARYDMVMAHSVLHLLPDRRAAIARVHALLKPGGLFVSSTICLKGEVPWIRPIFFVFGRLGLLPALRFIAPGELRAEIRDAGFEIVEDWHPGPRKALFLVARKTAAAAQSP